MKEILPDAKILEPEIINKCELLQDREGSYNDLNMNFLMDIKKKLIKALKLKWKDK